MKKKLGFIMLLGILALTACKKTEVPKETETTEAKMPETSQETTQAPKESKKTGEIATAYVTDMFESDFEQVKSGYEYDETMKTMVDDGSLEKALIPSLQTFGALIEMEEPFETVMGKNIIQSIPCRLANANINVNVVFNEKQQIIGINFAEYASPKNPSKPIAKVPVPEGVRELQMSLRLEGEQYLPGILTLPEQTGDYPVVVLVHGSGPNDMNETIGANTVFRDLAWGLAKKGVATYRYDKRTYVYGAEISKDTSFTVKDETVDDAVSAIAMIQTEDEINPREIYVLGHSQGGYLMPQIAADSPIAAGYILMAAPARALSELMGEQYDYLVNLDGAVTADEQNQLDSIKKELERIKNIDREDDDTLILGCYPTYWKSLEAYDGLKAAEAMQKPVLVMQGTQDYQVTMEDYGLWKKQFEKKENWQFEEFSGLTHLMMEGKKENGPSDYQIKQELDARVIDAIAEFVTPN